MRYAALAAAAFMLIQPAYAEKTPRDRSASIARRGPAMDLQLPGQAGLRPRPGRCARAVSFADLQGAGECRHLSGLRCRRDRIKSGQGRATGQQLLSGPAGRRVGDRARGGLFGGARLAKHPAPARAAHAGAQGDDRRLSGGQVADAGGNSAGGRQARHDGQAERHVHAQSFRQGGAEGEHEDDLCQQPGSAGYAVGILFCDRIAMSRSSASCRCCPGARAATPSTS